jgi:gamma-glutamyltranspeptidase/glutathione hydrolase
MFEPDGSAGLTYYGHPSTVGELARYGVLAPATPGAVAALCVAHGDRGRLQLARVLEPAIAAARAGVPFTGREVLAIARLADRIRELPDTAQVLLPGGRLPAAPVQGVADRLDTSALAGTLEAIAAGGASALYRGPIAARIAGYLQARGGILSAADLAGVRAEAIAEEPSTYRGVRYTTALDHIGTRALDRLEELELAEADPDSFDHRHRFAGALAAAFTEVAPLPPIDGTSQIVAADGEGLMVAITTAVGWDYGSLVYVPEVGVFLNNAMSYFDPRPGRRHSIAPGKAPIFGAPTLVAWDERGGRLACAGSGGYRIQTGVLHTATQILDRGADPAAALDFPRVHCQGGEIIASDRIEPAVIDALRASGHEVSVVSDRDPNTLPFARVCAIERDPASGALRASASPSWLTGVAGV